MYKNSLGHLEPSASISHFGGQYGNGGYLLFTTTAKNNPHKDMRWDNTPEAIASIAKWAEKNGYDIKEGRDRYNAYRAKLQHRDTAAALAAQMEAIAGTFKGAEVGYIRFGDVPEGGRSHNKATGGLEAGVSVFVGEFAKTGEFRAMPSTNQQLASLLCVQADDRPVYRVWGKVVGVGGDGEPVIKVTRTKLIG